MTSDEFTEALQSIGWSKRQLVEQLACSPELAQRWADGRASVPPSIARWLERMAACHERYPVPDDWRVR